MNERGAEIEIDAPTDVVGPVLTDLCIRVFQFRPDNRNGRMPEECPDADLPG